MIQQLLIHLWGDYIFQSDWMAMNKSRYSIPCLVHVLIYTSLFLLLTTSWKALLVIGVTHFILDRWHTPLKRLIWFKNHLNPQLSYMPFEFCDTTGYFDDSPYNRQKLSSQMEIHLTGLSDGQELHIAPRHFFITIWLYIITDNVFHLTINYLALAYL